MGFSRLQEKRDSFSADTGIATVGTLEETLARKDIDGAILTVPNEQYLPLAEAVAKAGKHVYTKQPITGTLEDGLAIVALQAAHGVTVTFWHIARRSSGIREIRRRIDVGELGKVGFIEANSSNEPALELTADTCRWYRDRAPGGPLWLLAIHMFDVVNYLGEEIVEASSMASILSPVGAEVDAQSVTLLRVSGGAIAYVGTCWTSPAHCVGDSVD